MGFFLGSFAMTDQSLSFDDVADLAVELGSSVSPAELHGLLVGQLATGKRFSQAQWLQEVAKLLDIDAPQDPVHQREFAQLYEQTLAQLEHEAMDFALLLPDQDVEFNQIVMSLSEWCAGFLAGYAIAGNGVVDEDTDEVLQDFAAISQVGEEDEIDETAQQALFEVAEYVRVAALSLFLAAGSDGGADAAPSSQSIH